jgi:hypothetical protein
MHFVHISYPWIIIIQLPRTEASPFFFSELGFLRLNLQGDAHELSKPRGQQKRETHIMNAIVRRRNLLSSSSRRRPLPVPSHTAKEKEGPDDSQGQGECESSTKEPSTNRPNSRQVDGFDALSPGCGQSSTTAVFVIVAHGAPGCGVVHGVGLDGRKQGMI